MNNERKLRVLIVEDEPIIALGLSEMLMAAGFSIAGVTGKLIKALALIELDAIDVALIDANLGGVSARPVGAALASRQIPYLVLSGYSEQQQAGKFPDAAAFLQKPCVPAQLVATLKRIAVKPTAVE